MSRSSGRKECVHAEVLLGKDSRAWARLPALGLGAELLHLGIHSASGGTTDAELFSLQWPCGSCAHDPNTVSSGVRGGGSAWITRGSHHHQPVLLPSPPCSEQNASPYLSGVLHLVMEQRYPQQSPSLCTQWIWALHQVQGQKQLCYSSTKAPLPPEGPCTALPPPAVLPGAPILLLGQALPLSCISVSKVTLIQEKE